MEFILHIITPCTGSWSSYSTLFIPVRVCGICSLVNKETLLELRSESRLDALRATAIDFSGILLCIQTIKPRPLCGLGL